MTARARPVWTDRRILRALHLMDVDGLSAREAGRRLGCTRNAVLGIRHRVRHAAERGFPLPTGDGSMAPGWGLAVRGWVP